MDPTLPAILTLLDAVRAVPDGVRTSVQLHDYNGHILDALAIWARRNEVEIRHHTLRNTTDRIEWDCFDIEGPWGMVDVHDHRSERAMVEPTAQDSTAGCWSVAQHTTEGAA